MTKDKGGTYNPQKTEGKPYTQARRKSADLYCEEGKAPSVLVGGV